MLQTQDLLFQYEKNTPILKFPDITLNKDKHLLILGKSGVGKTTLLHLLAGLLSPTQGTITYDQMDLHTASQKQIDRFRGDHIGLVFQKKHALSYLTVYNNLKARLLFSKTPINKGAIDTLLKQLGLYAYKDQSTRKLSEGQLQRLGIAMAVIHQPKIILADEPTSSLDDENCTRVIKLLKTQAQQTNSNLIVITHDIRIRSHFQNTIVL